MKKKTNYLMWGIFISIILVVGFLVYFNLPKNEDTGVSLKAYYIDSQGKTIPLDKESQKHPLSLVTFPSQSPVQTNSILLEATITAGSGTNSKAVHVSSVTASPSVYNSAISYTYPLILNPGQSDTRTSGTISTSTIETGDVNFILTVSGFFYNARGEQSPFSISSSPYTINIVPEESTLFRTQSKSYGVGTEIAYNPSCGGSMTRYIRSGSEYSYTQSCANVLSGEVQVPCQTTGEIGSTPCYWGTYSSNYKLCWDELGVGHYYNFVLGGSTVSTNPIFMNLPEEVSCGGTSCVTGDWTNEGCNQGGCVNQMYQTRISTPSGCNPISSQCVADASCTPIQTCSALGGSGCASGQTCNGGTMQDSSDYPNLCCVGGTCSSAYTKTKFRTSSLTYTKGLSASNWIAYASTCGNNLVGYGYDASTGYSVSCNTQFGAPLLDNLPHTGHLDQVNVDTEGDGILSLHTDGAYLRVCEDAPGTGNSGAYRYSTSRSNNAVLNPLFGTTPGLETPAVC